MKKLISLLLVFLLLPLAGCGAMAEDVSVMATFYPVYILAENVLQGVEGVTLSSMTPPSTGCLHLLGRVGMRFVRTPRRFPCEEPAVQPRDRAFFPEQDLRHIRHLLCRIDHLCTRPF